MPIPRGCGERIHAKTLQILGVAVGRIRMDEELSDMSIQVNE
jgi:hypothetical protein